MTASRTHLRKRLPSFPTSNKNVARILIGFWLLLIPQTNSLFAKDRWTELNVGPYKVDTDGDLQPAREALTQLEQLRWVLGGMLESKNLQALWPIRFLITRSAPATTDFTVAHGDYILVLAPGDRLPIDRVAHLFILANTPLLPKEVEAAFPRLFATFEAHGSRATFGGPPSNPDIDWARLQYFATKPAYAGRFPVFLNNLRAGSALRVAEANALGKNSDVLEQEVADYFHSGAAAAVTLSARPLDPKHDFGEHALSDVVANLYLADVRFDSDTAAAEKAYRAAVEAGYTALGQEGIARVVMQEKTDPHEYLSAAIAAGSKNAWVYVEDAEGKPLAQADALLTTAAALNPRWSEPWYRRSLLASTPADKETLLAKAAALNPRNGAYWEQLAVLQIANGHGIATQNSWIRAEDAAATPAERLRIHQHREQLEIQRLDAEDAARKRADDTRVAEDQRAHDAELDRIRTAEAKANQALGGKLTTDPKETVRWWNDNNPSVKGQLTRIDCLQKEARIWVKPAVGKLISLLIIDPSQVALDGENTSLSCGPQAPARPLTVTYKPRADHAAGTAGDVTAIHFE